MIKGLSEVRRLPRLGKIKLGVMVEPPPGGASKAAYPRATDYFVCPEVIRKVHGERPKELPVMFPSDDPKILFPQAYKLYRSSGLFCAGDGVQAHRWDEDGNLKERACPCEFLESGECGPVATLNLLLPEVPGLGVWQINTGNRESIINLNSGFESFGRAFGGLRGIPFRLVLEPVEKQRFDETRKRMVKTTVHALRLDTAMRLVDVMQWRKSIGAAVEPMMLPEMTVAPQEPIDKPQPGPESPAESQLEDLWTLALDLNHGSAIEALPWARQRAAELFGRAVESLQDLTPDEVRRMVVNLEKELESRQG